MGTETARIYSNRTKLYFGTGGCLTGTGAGVYCVWEKGMVCEASAVCGGWRCVGVQILAATHMCTAHWTSLAEFRPTASGAALLVRGRHMLQWSSVTTCGSARHLGLLLQPAHCWRIVSTRYLVPRSEVAPVPPPLHLEASPQWNPTVPRCDSLRLAAHWRRWPLQQSRLNPLTRYSSPSGYR